MNGYSKVEILFSKLKIKYKIIIWLFFAFCDDVIMETTTQRQLWHRERWATKYLKEYSVK